MSPNTEVVADGESHALAVTPPEPDWVALSQEMQARGAHLGRTPCGCVITVLHVAPDVKALPVVYPCRAHTPHGLTAPCAVCGRAVEALSDHVHPAWRL